MRIGTLAAEAGVSTKAIRFYEEAGLMPAPPRTPGGYRDYPPQAADRLSFIRNAQAAGLTLAEIRDVLAVRDGGQAPCEHVGALISEHLRQAEERIADLTRARSALLELEAAAAATDPATCPDGPICRILNATARPSADGSQAH
ncbi:heavy metal-responsive transcriptional regulator [Streptomyces sp. ISL-100]|uniref:heavy metal-responsive transcriptional regulator n=1 Tax=Streptomyces sp. ISL-100 TaxID=2819173 RepID=UPI001BEA9038|nr:heavy metal-responsive transcriptional regulator [Streptomyces sp. ISL-100]MBT2400496.1 heavy metal-responsive transcriptional regulator [Streptomyces sp. ISL-100]